MRAGTIITVLAVAGLGVASVARAQDPPKLAQASEVRLERFLGLDPFAGGNTSLDVPQPGGDASNAATTGPWGWDVGATVRFGARWFGLTGTMGRHTVVGTVGHDTSASVDLMPTHQFVAGPSVMTNTWPSSALRFFAHALVGYAATSGVTPSDGSLVGVIGFGLDFTVLRFEFDTVRVSLNGQQGWEGRMFIGGIFPLCLRGCREEDGLNLSGRSSTR